MLRLKVGRGDRPRLLALLTFRDEMRFLPGYFANVPSQVDGIVALDDESTDGSTEFVASQPSVLELLCTSRTATEGWSDAVNHRRLVEAAWQYHPDWLLGVDADERLERHFRTRANALTRRTEGAAFRVTTREVWGAPDPYRVDGIWGAKGSARLFRARRDHVFDERTLHGHWAPLNDYPDGIFPAADLVIYHLRTMLAADREARRAKYEHLDPEHRHQAIGYAYMTDAEGLQIERLPPGREYKPSGV